MELHDEAEDIPLPLRGKTVARCIVDSALGIDFQEEGTRSLIRIKGRFLLRGLGADRAVSITRVEEMGAALSLIGKTVAKALARSDGALGVTFEDGTVLSVPPDSSTEAWAFAGPDRSVVVSRAGGGLDTWVEADVPQARRPP